MHMYFHIYIYIYMYCIFTIFPMMCLHTYMYVCIWFATIYIGTCIYICMVSNKKFLLPVYNSPWRNPTILSCVPDCHVTFSGCLRTYVHVHVECRGFESHLRQMGEYASTQMLVIHLFLRKNDCLGCAVLLYLVCLFDLACLFLPSFSHLSFKHVYTRFGVWCLWWFHYPGLLLYTELIVSLFIRCIL